MSLFLFVFFFLVSTSNCYFLEESNHDTTTQGSQMCTIMSCVLNMQASRQVLISNSFVICFVFFFRLLTWEPDGMISALAIPNGDEYQPNNEASHPLAYNSR